MNIKTLLKKMSLKEKAYQRALLQYFKPENRQLVRDALKKAKRFDCSGDNVYYLCRY